MPDIPTDCLYQDERTEVPSNADISGPGVLASFMGTAYLSLCIVTVYYFIGFNAKVDPYYEKKEGTAIGRHTSEDQMTLVENRIPISDSNAARDSDTAVQTDSAPIAMDNLQPRQQNSSEITGPPRLVDTETGPHEGRTPLAEADAPNYHSDEAWTPNPVDERLLDCIRTYMPRRWLHVEIPRAATRPDPRVEGAFTKCMLAFSDVQVATGLGILVSAYATLGGTDGISAYHWQISVYLAWLSNLTHLAGLTFLRRYLAEEKRRVERNLRIVATASLVLPLTISLVPLRNFQFIMGDGRPSVARPSSLARCFFSDKVSRHRWVDTSFYVDRVDEATDVAIGILLLLYTFGTRVVKLARVPSQFIRSKVRGSIRKILLRKLNKVQESEAFKNRPYALHDPRFEVYAAVFLTMRQCADLYSSMMSEVYWAWLAGAWVTIRLVKSLASASPSNEDELTFGQVLAIFLLGLPLAAVGSQFIPLLWRMPPSKPEPPGTPGGQYADMSQRPKVWPRYMDYDDLLWRKLSYDAPWSSAVLWLIMFSTTCAALPMVTMALQGMTPRSSAGFSLAFPITPVFVTLAQSVSVNAFGLLACGRSEVSLSYNRPQISFISAGRPWIWWVLCWVMAASLFASTIIVLNVQLPSQARFSALTFMSFYQPAWAAPLIFMGFYAFCSNMFLGTWRMGRRFMLTLAFRAPEGCYIRNIKFV